MEELMSMKKQTATTMNSSRKISLAAGVLYLLTFVSIPTLVIYSQVKSANYIISAGPDISTVIGGILEIIVALTGIGTAIVLFPVLKKQNEGLALGLVASRTLEAATIFLGVAFILSVVSLRQSGAGVDALIVSRAFVVLYDRIFLLGQSFMPAINDLLLGYLLYKSRLVPQGLALIGLIGGPILIAGYMTVMFNLIGQHDPLAGLSAIPVALFEFSLGVWFIVKGFNQSALFSLSANTDK